MSRRLLVAVGPAVVFAAAAAAHTRVEEVQPTTLATVRGSVVSLAQDGSHVAWIPSRGLPVQTLSLPGRRRVAVGASVVRQGCWRCSLLRPIAVGAGGRVLWQEVTDGGNTYIVVSVITAAPGSPRGRGLASTYTGIEESDPDWINPEPGGLPAAADGKAFLFYAACDTGLLCRRRTAGIYRLAGRRVQRLAKKTDPVALAVNGRRFAVATNSYRCCNLTPAWSHDGSRVAWIYHGNLWTVRADGTGDERLATGLLPPHWSADAGRRPSWSPDGTRLVFDRTRPDPRRTGRRQTLGVYRVDATGKGLRRLAAGTAPTWSLDGKSIAFVRDNGVLAMRPDGTGTARLTATRRATAEPLSWSPDSTRIAVARGGDIYSVRADGGGETRLTTTRGPEVQPSWSPDGTRIAYTSAGAVWVMNADGSGATRLAAGGSEPAWSPDSTTIAFVRSDALWIVNANGGGVRRLSQSPSESTSPTSPQWAPGREILVGDYFSLAGIYPSDPGIRRVSPVDRKARKIAPVPRSPVEVRRTAAGRMVSRFVIEGHVRALALGPDYVASVVDHSGIVRVEVHNLGGTIRKAVRVPSSVRSISAAGRNVVFAAGHAIRRLDARTGAVSTLATARRAPVGPTIEGRRVVWAENGRGTARIRTVNVR
jgi:WD40-like Beta Propeller Repeat